MKVNNDEICKVIGDLFVNSLSICETKPTKIDGEKLFQLPPCSNGRRREARGDNVLKFVLFFFSFPPHQWVPISLCAQVSVE